MPEILINLFLTLVVNLYNVTVKQIFNEEKQNNEMNVPIIKDI